MEVDSDAELPVPTDALKRIEKSYRRSIHRVTISTVLNENRSRLAVT